MAVSHIRLQSIDKETHHLPHATMACTNDPPTYVYKLVPHTSPVPTRPTDFPDALPVSALDQASGFLHLSTAPQVPGTLAHFFRADPRAYVLRIPYAPLADAGLVRWEDPEAAVCGPRPREGLFPHVYNGLRLGRHEVESVWVLEKGTEGEGVGWEEVIAGDAAFQAWLVY